MKYIWLIPAYVVLFFVILAFSFDAAIVYASAMLIFGFVVFAIAAWDDAYGGHSKLDE